MSWFWAHFFPAPPILLSLGSFPTVPPSLINCPLLPSPLPSWKKSAAFTWEKSWEHLDLYPSHFLSVRSLQGAGAGGIWELRNEFGLTAKGTANPGIPAASKPALVLSRRKGRVRDECYWDTASFICIFSKIWILLKCHKSLAGAEEYGIC